MIDNPEVIPDSAPVPQVKKAEGAEGALTTARYNHRVANLGPSLPAAPAAPLDPS